MTDCSCFPSFLSNSVFCVCMLSFDYGMRMVIINFHHIPTYAQRVRSNQFFLSIFYLVDKNDNNLKQKKRRSRTKANFLSII